MTGLHRVSASTVLLYVVVLVVLDTCHPGGRAPATIGWT
jgi:hypothetical protein